MSRENVELVRAAYELAARGGFDYSNFDLWAKDFEFVTSPELPDAGTYRGADARRWIDGWVNSFEDLTMEATEVLDSGDKVMVGIHQRGRLPGSRRTVEGRWWQILTFNEDGLAVRSELFPERAQALEAVGLRE